jgi:hypothetical protein
MPNMYEEYGDPLLDPATGHVVRRVRRCEEKMKLTIAKQGKSFVVDDLSRPGSPPVGRGRTMREAVGDYFHQNQTELNIEFEVDPSAQDAENRRRTYELSKR